MFNSRNGGLVAAPASGAPVRGILFALLIVAIALRRLDWWKLFEHAPRLMTGRSGFALQAMALGLTLGGADAAQELAPQEDTRLRHVVTHAALRAVLEVAVFYGLIAAALACGLSGGVCEGDHESDLLAYLADAFVSGWGEPVLHAIVCAAFVAASDAGRSESGAEPIQRKSMLQLDCGTSRHDQPEGDARRILLCRDARGRADVVRPPRGGL